MATVTASSIEQLLGAKAESLLGFKNPKIAKERLHVPGPDLRRIPTTLIAKIS